MRDAPRGRSAHHRHPAPWPPLVSTGRCDVDRARVPDLGQHKWRTSSTRTSRDPTAAGRSAPRDGREGGSAAAEAQPLATTSRPVSARAHQSSGGVARASRKDATLPSAARTFRGRAAALGVSMGIWLPTPPRRRWGKVWVRPSPLALRGLARSERDARVRNEATRWTHGRTCGAVPANPAPAIGMFSCAALSKLTAGVMRTPCTDVRSPTARRPVRHTRSARPEKPMRRAFWNLGATTRTLG